MNEKSINISLTKIFNYSDDEEHPTLSISFYSKKTETLITKKATHCTCMNKCLNLSINLKINYTSQENSILVMVEEISENNQECDLFCMIGQSQINLDQLQEKKIKYYNIGDDQILQVEVYEGKKPKRLIDNASENFISPIEEREKFLRDRRKFLQRIRDTQAILKKNFSDKIFQLISDSKSLRQQRHFQDNQDNLLYEPDEQEYSQSRLKKSRSDLALNNLRNKGFFTTPTPVKQQAKQPKQPKQKSSPQKHKLMLNTLNVVQHQRNQYPKKSLFREKH